jgi:hypothetical protein
MTTGVPTEMREKSSRVPLLRLRRDRVAAESHAIRLQERLSRVDEELTPGLVNDDPGIPDRRRQAGRRRGRSYRG